MWLFGVGVSLVWAEVTGNEVEVTGDGAVGTTTLVVVRVATGTARPLRPGVFAQR